MSFSAIIVAAGTGSRAGEAKQWRSLGGKPVIRWSVEAMLRAGASDVVVVVAPGSETAAATALTDLSG
jgi:2-C-methyl-D-erythritol 4-phosphate cytidylyltransferase/2-C-methyl-D-erythritol 2,4-cyclodiphosphate synthase